MNGFLLHGPKPTPGPDSTGLTALWPLKVFEKCRNVGEKLKRKSRTLRDEASRCSGSDSQSVGPTVNSGPARGGIGPSASRINRAVGNPDQRFSSTGGEAAGRAPLLLVHSLDWTALAGLHGESLAFESPIVIVNHEGHLLAAVTSLKSDQRKVRAVCCVWGGVQWKSFCCRTFSQNLEAH